MLVEMLDGFFFIIIYFVKERSNNTWNVNAEVLASD